VNWDAIGAIGEILGAIAVVVTLLYLTAQLKQNSLQIRLSSSQTAASNYSGNIIGVLSDTDSLALFRKGLATFSTLSADEQARFHAIMLGFHTSFSQNLHLFDEGVISQGLFNSWAEDWVRILKCPGAAQWWSRFQGMVDSELRTHVDALVSQSDAPPLNEMVPFLRIG
jgi:hypothetical protein